MPRSLWGIANDLSDAEAWLDRGRKYDHRLTGMREHGATSVAIFWIFYALARGGRSTSTRETKSGRVKCGNSCHTRRMPQGWGLWPTTCSMPKRRRWAPTPSTATAYALMCAPNFACTYLFISSSFFAFHLCCPLLPLTSLHFLLCAPFLFAPNSIPKSLYLSRMFVYTWFDYFLSFSLCLMPYRVVTEAKNPVTTKNSIAIYLEISPGVIF